MTQSKNEDGGNDTETAQPDTNLMTDGLFETSSTSCPPQAKKQRLSASEKRRQYVACLSYKREWEKKYPWVSCVLIVTGECLV